MKNVDEVYRDEELLYKPNKKKKKPKKANHKHVYENCVYNVTINGIELDPAHGFIDKTYLSIGTYCPICGKIGVICDNKNLKYYERNSNMFHGTTTDEGEKELSSETRTLPFFFVDDWWQKEVQLD